MQYIIIEPVYKAIMGFVKPGHKYIKREKKASGYRYFYEEGQPGEREIKVFSDDQHSAILEAMRIIAGMCDGARKLDEMGFDKFDAQIGRDLAAKDSLTQKQAEFASKLVLKYHRQLPKQILSRVGAGGQIVKEIIAVPKAEILVTNDKNELIIYFDYEARLKDKIKAMGARFDPIKKAWRINVEEVDKLFSNFPYFVMTDDAKAMVEAAQDRKVIQKEKTEAALVNVPPEIIEWRMPALAMLKDQVSKLYQENVFNNFYASFMNSVVGRDYDKLSTKQQRVVDQVQNILDNYLQRHPEEKIEWYNTKSFLKQTADSKKIAIGVSLAEKVAEKNNSIFDTPAFVKKELLRNMDLDPYQKKGVNWLLKVKSGILGFDVGLGKTIQAIVAAQSVQGENKKAIVIVPKARLYGWEQEINTLTTKKAVVISGTPKERAEQLKLAEKADFVITSYGMLQGEPEKLADLRPRTIIVDEAHRLAGYKTLQGKNFDKYFQRLENKYFLTASPQPNRPPGMYTMMNHLYPGVLGKFKDDFMANYCITEETRYGTAILGYQNLDKLHDRIAPYVFMKKQDAEDVNIVMPPVRHPKLILNMDDDQRKLYNKIEDEALAYLKSINPAKFNNQDRMIILTKILRLEQCAIHPKMIDPNYKGKSAKVEEVKNIIRDHFSGDEKRGVLVYSRFKEVISILKDELVGMGFLKDDIAVISGQIPAKEIQEIQDGMNSGKYKICISSDAGKEGLNLQGNANLMIHMDTPWSPYVITQREGRIYRPGQKSPVTIYRPMMDDSVEYRKQKVVNMKEEWVDAILNGKNPGDFGTKLGLSDLADIIGGRKK